jgi:hypothetical protein
MSVLAAPNDESCAAMDRGCVDLTGILRRPIVLRHQAVVPISVPTAYSPPPPLQRPGCPSALLVTLGLLCFAGAPADAAPTSVNRAVAPRFNSVTEGADTVIQVRRFEFRSLPIGRGWARAGGLAITAPR